MESYMENVLMVIGHPQWPMSFGNNFIAEIKFRVKDLSPHLPLAHLPTHT